MGDLIYILVFAKQFKLETNLEERISLIKPCVDFVICCQICAGRIPGVEFHRDSARFAPILKMEYQP